MKRLFTRCLSILCGTALLSTSVLASDDASCKAVRMGVVNWTDVIATSGMADVLLNGLGYESKQTSAVQQIIFAGIRDKRLDIFLGYYRTEAKPLLFTPPLANGASSRPNAYGFGTLVTQDTYLDSLDRLPKGSGRVWLIGTVDVPDEFAPLPSGWQRSGETQAGGATARLFVLH